MEDEQWLINRLEELLKRSRDYKQKALLQAAINLILEQEERKEQLQGELDGRLWNPGNWGS
ncbi:hypothetical protein ACEN4P_11940 [Marinilactibacillus psychrotolerans]|uniref:Uncharacterized protein n=2 Tax=Marinilactibacillus psychrotolerans TaxID=191770 RepID=A0A5R9C268_9LACT|nr:hypothetical protein [Marinilactibacillus psychrotolerans]TLQ06820.1 hypothetical protein FEZ48_08420 [Marinilactibacillus psychrotolerans]GEQ32488.1 hypothetical protein B795N_03700 [Marinilactibacillus psychrotolerans]SJN41329.1 hypothetical protein FM115_08860 [Marinilactibacillus psychrotolerans 42ea]